MKIRTFHDPKPIPDKRFDWCALDEDTYEGNSSPIGYGRTEQEAIEELRAQLP